MSDSAPDKLLHTGAAVSSSNLLRQLKRQENSLYNCICSIVDDAAFVRTICGLYPSLPMYANLRCGLWYTPRPQGTCYFKSTDGHNGNWSFSTVRLNLHIAAAAAASEGCIIVDATRRGKTFPDAFTKTIPIWAAVLNRAIARVRAGSSANEQVSNASERSRSTAELRPLVACSSPPEELAEKSNADSHAFPDSASASSSREQDAVSAQQDLQALQQRVEHSGAQSSITSGCNPLSSGRLQYDGSAGSNSWKSTTESAHGTACDPETQVLCSKPSHKSSSPRPPKSIDPAELAMQAEAFASHTTTLDQDSAAAADHHNVLFAGRTAPSAECSTRGAAEDNGSQERRDGNSSAGSGAAEAWDTKLHLPLWISGNERAQIERRLDGWVDLLLQSGADLQPLAAALRRPLRPLWVSQNSRIWLNEVAPPESLAFTPLLLLSASAPNLRQRRCVGSPQEPEGEGGAGVWTFQYMPGAGDDEESWARGLTPQLLWAHQEALLAAGPDRVKDLTYCLVHRAVAAVPQPGGAPQELERVDSAELAGGAAWLGRTGIAVGPHASGNPACVWRTVDAVLNCGSEEHAGMAPEAVMRREDQPFKDSDATYDPPDTLSRYLWLPVASVKEDRFSLQAQLAPSLRFLACHLARGHHVLVHCHDGLERSVCIALALLLQCYAKLPTTPGAPLHCDRPFPAHCLSTDGRLDGCPRIGISKHHVRQALAFVSAAYPAARPSRGMLRQVFNFFQPAQEQDISADMQS